MLFHLKKGLALAATAAFVAFGAGCSSSAKKAATGSAKVSMSGAAITADVATMTLTVGPGTGTPSFSNIVVQMSKNTNAEWNGYVGGIPAGTGRTFHIDAFKADSTKLYTGDATATITAGGTAMVFMMLQDALPPNQFNNHAPVVDSLTASSGLVTPGTVVNLGITAHDPDTATTPDNKISGYLWTATCGTLTGATTTTPTWTAPATDQTCTINVTVSDVCPANQPAVCSSSVTATLQIIVQSSQNGNANVTAYPNTCPAITCVSGAEHFTYDSAGKVNGYEADLTVAAADSDDTDELHYVWSSVGCPGALFIPTNANPTTEIVTTPTTVHFIANTTVACQIRVDVKDYWKTIPAGSGLPAARGCDNVGFLSLAGATNFTYPPIIANLIQPNANNKVKAGQTYTFGAASVSDPQNAYPLTITWTNNGGTGSALSSPVPATGTLTAAGLVSTVWTAPASLVSGMNIVLTVTNHLGLSATQTFNIVPADACATSPDGSPCDDGDACTGGTGAATPDHCQAGVCVGGTAVVCTASDSCHVAGVCDKSSGTCSNPVATQGTSCNADNNACTAGDACNASGACIAGAPVVCTALDSCHAAGVCDTGTGTCSNPALPQNTTCTPVGSYNHCFTSYACDATATCAAVTASAVSCAGGACSTGGTCNTTNGHCEGGSNQPVTVACDDGNPCTTSDHCDGNGACVGGGAKCSAGQTCDSSGTCHATGVQWDVMRDLQISTPGSLAMDSSGASYIVSSISSTNPIDFDGHAVASNGDQDVFVAKYDTTGHASWAFNFGDAANPQVGSGVAVTQDGTVAMIGNFNGSMTIGTALSSPSTVDFLATVNSSNGAGKWAKMFDDGSNGGLVSVAANPNSTTNRIAVCGFSSAAATALTGATTFGGGTDAVIAWFKSDGTAVQAFELGNAGNETCNAVAVDDNGDVYAAGQFDGATMTIGSFTLTGPGSTSRKYLWVAKFNGTSGAVISAAAFSGTSAGAAAPTGLTVDASGKVTVVGNFTSTLVFGALPSLASAGNTDAFIAKLDPSTTPGVVTPIWAVRMGGTSQDTAQAVAVTSFGDVVVTGYFYKTTTGAAVLTAHGNTASDVFVLKLNGGTGTLDWSAGYGDSGTQTGDAIVVNRFGTDQVAMAGTINGTFAMGSLAPVTAAGGTDLFFSVGHLFAQ